MLKKYILLPVLSSKGSLAVQFLFGWVLIMGFVFIFGALSLTLMAGETVQYITYSTARWYSLGSDFYFRQNNQAKAKYAALKKAGNLKKLLSGQLFEISPEPNLGLNPRFRPSAGRPYLFVGAWTSFNAKLLDIDIPLWGGKTSADNPAGFQTQIGSYLGREPTIEECREFNKKRWKWIEAVHKTKFRGVFQPKVNPARYYRSAADNGC